MRPQPETIGIHGDDAGHDGHEKSGLVESDIAPSMHVSTIFDRSMGDYVYSRDDAPTRARAEQLIAKMEQGEHAVLFSSGMAAISAVLMALKPKRVATLPGYHGTKALLKYLSHMIQTIDAERDGIEALSSGDLIIFETPINPTGQVIDIKKYSEMARARGAYLCVDGTLAPPPLQFPLLLGAHIVMQSATKFYGGHSDLMAGILVTNDSLLADRFKECRTHFGSVPGSLECWLLIRSIRTLTLRVERQSATATELARWLHDNRDRFKIKSVLHASLSHRPLPTGQMHGHSPLFSIIFEDGEKAQDVRKRLRLFRNATSLGGTESLVDWRHAVDPAVDPGLLRLSIGCEALVDLKQDLLAAMSSSSSSDTCARSLL